MRQACLPHLEETTGVHRLKGLMADTAEDRLGDKAERLKASRELGRPDEALQDMSLAPGHAATGGLDCE